MRSDRQRLLWVKIAHTIVWVVVAGAIFALYPAIALGAWGLFAWLHVLIVAELVALAAFGGKCPLTVIAERYTEDRAPNFDIFLPRAIAEHNKVIFTVILVVAWTWALVRW